MSNFLYQTPALQIAAILFVLIITLNRAGFAVRENETKKHGGKPAELGPVEGSLLGLLALLLSFTFSLSASKNDARQEVIVEEANDISTAISRHDKKTVADIFYWIYQCEDGLLRRGT